MFLSFDPEADTGIGVEFSIEAVEAEAAAVVVVVVAPAVAVTFADLGLGRFGSPLGAGGVVTLAAWVLRGLVVLGFAPGGVVLGELSGVAGALVTALTGSILLFASLIANVGAKG